MTLPFNRIQKEFNVLTLTAGQKPETSSLLFDFTPSWL